MDIIAKKLLIVGAALERGRNEVGGESSRGGSCDRASLGLEKKEVLKMFSKLEILDCKAS